MLSFLLFLHQLGGRYVLNIFLTWNSCSLLRKKVKQNARPQFRLRDTRIKLKVVVVSRRRKVKENLFFNPKNFQATHTNDLENVIDDSRKIFKEQLKHLSSLFIWSDLT